MINAFQTQFVVEHLWRATWQSAAIAAVVAVLMLAARKQIAPRWRVVLWTLPLVRLAFLVVPGSSLSLFNMFESAQTIAASSPVESQIAVPDSNFAFGGALIVTDQVDLPVRGNTDLFTTESSGVNQKSIDVTIDSAGQLGNFAILFWAWLVGCTFSGLLFILGKVQLTSVIARAKTLHRVPIADRLESRYRALGLWRRVTCLIVKGEIGPASTGLIRPKILIPQTLLSELNDAELATIIEHELQHICRFDAVFLLLGRFVCCVHWFNPLVYWLSARVRTEIELAVDAKTVEQMDDHSRITYGNLLLQLGTRRSRSLGLAPMADRRSNLKERISELASPTRNTTLRSVCCMVAIMLLVVTCLSDVASTQESTTALPPATKASQEPSTKADAKFGTIRIAPETSLAAAVAQFNEKANEHTIGKHQEPVTVDEVVAIIRRWPVQKEPSPAVKATFEEIANTGVLKASGELRFDTGYWKDENYISVWWVTLTVDNFRLRIRDRTLASRKQTDEEKLYREEHRASVNERLKALHASRLENDMDSDPLHPSGIIFTDEIDAASIVPFQHEIRDWCREPQLEIGVDQSRTRLSSRTSQLPPLLPLQRLKRG